MLMLPQLRFEPPPLYFMHIMKTAGTSLRDILRGIYGAQRFKEVYGQDLYKIDPLTVPTYRCFASHLGASLLPYLQQKDLRCITFLRDPVEQKISHIYFRRHNLLHQPELCDPIHVAQMRPLLQADLSAWLDAPYTRIEDNVQTRTLGTVKDVAPYFKGGAASEATANKPWLVQPVHLVDASDMASVAARARQQLENMAVVGLTERFAESVALLCAQLGVPPPATLPQQNINQHKVNSQLFSYRQQVAPALVERIEAENRYDCELYAYACELFAERLAQHQAKPQRVYSIGPHLRPAARQSLTAASKIVRRVAPQLTKNRSLRTRYASLRRRLA